MTDALLPTIVGLVLAQRIAELLYARHTARGLIALGARAIRPDGYAAIVAVHALWFVGLAAEGALSPWRSHAWLWPALLVYVAGGALRYSSMVALGPRWSTRVFALPGAALVRSGPYRWLRHPIYVGVSLELAALPLAFGAWGTATLATLANAWALRHRIGIEEAALAGEGLIVR